MSKITRTEGLVLLILALCTTYIFSGITRGVKGASSTLVSVTINDSDVGSNPNLVIDARLRTSLNVNVTWNMSYDPENYGYGWMQISLYNNVSMLHNSSLFTERGTNINKVWICPLIPEEWTLANNREYGRVKVSIFTYDGNMPISVTQNYTVRALPEQVNLSLSSYVFKNDSNGRMMHLNASYYVTSKQDPSFHHPNLQFSCKIFDDTYVLTKTLDFYVNSLGFLDVIVDRDYLIFLEGQTMKITNQATTLIEPISIETDMGSIVNRTDFLLYFQNLTEIYSDDNVSVVVNIEAGTATNGTSVSTIPLYYEWTVSNGTGSSLQNGTSFEYLGQMMSINLDPSLTPVIEQLTVNIWFEGNFIFKSKQISLQLRDQVFREEIKIYLTNQAALLADGIGALCFQLTGKQTEIPVPNHLARIVIINETAGNAMSSIVLETDGNGCTTLSLSEEAIRDLENIVLQVQAFSTLTFKETIQNFPLGDIFQRALPILRINNGSSSFTLRSSSENTISMSVLADGNDSFFSGRLANLEFRDEHGTVILKCDALVGRNGMIVCPLPVQSLRAGQTVYISVMIDATLKNQELSSIVWFYVVAIIDPTGTSAMMASASMVFILVAIIGLLIIVRCVKKAHHNFLSKDSFTIHVT